MSNQQERFAPLNLPPGVHKQGTEYQNQGQWFDANGVRWYEKTMGPVGGWRKVTDTSNVAIQVSGIPRAAHGWKANNGVSWLGIGTTTKLYKYSDGVLDDITPGDLTTGGANSSQGSGAYGRGNYGAGNYGHGTGAQTIVPPGTWQLDNFGEDLMATLTSDGRILKAAPGDSVAAPITGDADLPLDIRGLVVTPERFLVALGGKQADAVEDRRRVAWASQETTDVWTASDTNSAGNFFLPSKGELLAGRRSRRQTMLWTDVDVYAMTFIGGTAVYAFEQLGDNCGAISPQAMVVLGDVMFWMSYGKFFVYDGALKPLECSVLDYVFNDLNQSERAKIQAIPNTLFDEIVWTYPSKTQTGRENDRYVAYNFREQHWTIGKLARAAGIDRGVFEYPVWLDPDGFVYEHEFGDDRTGLVGGVFAESGPVEIESGTLTARVQRFIPDELSQGDVSVKLLTRMYPEDVEKVRGPYTLEKITSVRFTARQARVRIDEVNAVRWRWGIPRLGWIAGSQR